jgi:hypothetical protein
MHKHEFGLIPAVFFGTWVVLGLVMLFLFLVSKNGRRKRRLFLPFIVLISVLFVGFATLMARSWLVVVLLAPVTALIALGNWYTTQFCLHCGATSIQRQLLPFARAHACKRCGKPFDSDPDRSPAAE